MLQITEMLVDSRTNPVGLDAQPRFTWKLKSGEENTMQTAYRLRVGDFWDTGRVESGDSVLVPFSGPALAPRTAYRVTVDVWDNHGGTASAEASFETGLLTPDNFKAQWIADPFESEHALPVFETLFTVSAPVTSARLYATAHGIYEAELDGEKLGSVELMARLNKIGGENGVGIIDIVENRLVGMKSRGVYETPGGTILYKAHEQLEMICLDKDIQHFKQQIAPRFAELVYNGQWFTPLREALSAFVDKTQETVTGDVRMKIYKGNIIPAGMKSPYSLYSEEIATFGEEDVYDQHDAEGFINLFGLPIKVRALLANKEIK